MSNLKKNQKFLQHLVCLFIISSLILLLPACKSIPPNRGISSENPLYIEENFKFEEIEEPYKYIFIRLYNPNYINPLYIANILKFGINLTNIDPETAVSHASINFSLNDNYYGLTQNGGFELAQESCSDTSTNGYMEKCDPSNSQQITYAIRVTEDEYNNAKNFIDDYIKNEEIRYKVSINFQMTSFSIKRKFFTPKEKKLFGNIDYASSTKQERLEFDPDYTENNFVCSTFVAYVLTKNVASVNQFFNDNNINYRYVNVGDLQYIPGVVKLFSSTWDYYLSGARRFVRLNPEFAEYLTD